ncbi:MAG: PilZ domain-containing protein [Sphingomicrobium sp.]
MIKAHLVKADDDSDRRRAPRVDVKIDARVRELGTEGAEARILNLSDTGFMAESTAAFDVGARIWLLLPGRERAAAIVRWTAGNRLGAEFAERAEAAALAG